MCPIWCIYCVWERSASVCQIESIFCVSQKYHWLNYNKWVFFVRLVYFYWDVGVMLLFTSFSSSNITISFKSTKYMFVFLIHFGRCCIFFLLLLLLLSLSSVQFQNWVVVGFFLWFSDSVMCTYRTHIKNNRVKQINQCPVFLVFIVFCECFLPFSLLMCSYVFYWYIELFFCLRGERESIWH